MKNPEKLVVINRGLVGSGKSTYTKQNYPTAVVCSADNFFINKTTGNYEFNPMMLGRAHDTCKNCFKDAVNQVKPLIVVDNTNTTLKEFQFYIQYAELHGYTVKVNRFVVSPETSFKRNTHKVPMETIRKMAQRFTDYPGEELIHTE